MNTALKSLILAFLVALVFDKGSAVDCYNCVSVSLGGSDTCSSPVAGTATDTCSGQCQTISTFLLNSLTTVTRSCVASCSAGEALYSGTGTKTECCSTSLCNSADSSSLDGSNGGGSDSCYSCTWPGENNCRSPDSTTGTSTCSSCSTTATYTSGDLTSVQRMCNPYCAASDLTAGSVRTATTCCSTDLCNNDHSDVGRAVVSLAALMTSAIISVYILL